MLELRCQTCNYKWFQKNDLIPPRCPYCDRENTILTADQARKEFFKDLLQ